MYSSLSLWQSVSVFTPVGLPPTGTQRFHQGQSHAQQTSDVDHSRPTLDTDVDAAAAVTVVVVVVVVAEETEGS